MTKLWGGRFTEATIAEVDAFTASIGFDARLAAADIRGSIAHARMLGQAGIIPDRDAEKIVLGLEDLLREATAGTLTFRVEDEDIHMNVERLLTERIGAVAGKLHTARSRNDQVATSMHLFMRSAVSEVLQEIRALQVTLVEQAERNIDVIIPGYTHLQRAQPVLLAHHLLAYFWMLERDADRMESTLQRMNLLPLGAGALAGTTFPIRRELVAAELEFDGLYQNSLDAVSNRDYLLEFLSNASICIMHLSRFSEELVLWSSEEFGYIELADRYCTGSSMMPQKKNPDVPELVRGKTGRVYGHLIALLTVMKGLPLAYNKDLQEDKEGVFDTLDTLLPALRIFRGMISTWTIHSQRLEMAFDRDFSAATDLADELARRGLPFRQAHAVVGQLVQRALSRGVGLADLSVEDFQELSPLFDERVHDLLQLRHVVDSRSAVGGTATCAVVQQLAAAKQSSAFASRSERS